MSLIDADCGSATDMFFNLDESKENFKMGKVDSEHGVWRIGDTDWVIYSKRVYVKSIDNEYGGEVFIYNLFTEEEIELRKVDEDVVWSNSFEIDESSIYEIIKTEVYEGKNVNTVDEIIDFRDDKYTKMMESPRPLSIENIYFEYTNPEYREMYVSKLIVEGEYTYLYRLPYIDGTCEKVEIWDTEIFPSNTHAVCKIRRDELESYMYVYESEGRLIIEETIGSGARVIKVLN